MPCAIALTAGLLVLTSAAQGQPDGEPAPTPPDLTNLSYVASPMEADPDAPRGLIVNEPGAMVGYTLFAPLLSRNVYLIDVQGDVVHTWVTDSAPGAWVYLLDDGTLLRLGREDQNPHFEGGGIGGRLQKLTPDGTVRWSWHVANEERTQHHDAEPLPNGNLLLIVWERISRDETVARGRDIFRRECSSGRSRRQHWPSRRATMPSAPAANPRRLLPA